MYNSQVQQNQAHKSPCHDCMLWQSSAFQNKLVSQTVPNSMATVVDRTPKRCAAASAAPMSIYSHYHRTCTVQLLLGCSPVNAEDQCLCMRDEATSGAFSLQSPTSSMDCMDPNCSVNCLQGVDNYQVDNLADDIACLVKALGHESCILVAHDWGGMISWLVAHKHSSLINKLVIISAPHPKCTYDWDQDKRYALDSHTIVFSQNVVTLSLAMTCCCCCMYSTASHALFDTTTGLTHSSERYR